MKSVVKTSLPQMFKPIMWSYRFEECDPMRMKKTVIMQALRYGSMAHWNWIRSFYGDESIKEVLHHIQETEIPSKTRQLVKIVFNFDQSHYASRSAH